MDGQTAARRDDGAVQFSARRAAASADRRWAVQLKARLLIDSVLLLQPKEVRKLFVPESGVATRGILRSLKGGGVTRPLWTFRCGFADVWVSAEEEKVSRGRGRIGRKGPPWWIQREEWHCERCLASTRWPLATMKHQRTGIGIPHAPVLRDRPHMVPNQWNKQQK